jgi:hypothetical protein
VCGKICGKIYGIAWKNLANKKAPVLGAVKKLVPEVVQP